MIKFYACILFGLMGLSYAQMTGVIPSSETGVEADWISLGLISIFFLLLLTVYKHSKNSKQKYGRGRQQDEADAELLNRK